jgi:hypothetical protein
MRIVIDREIEAETGAIIAEQVIHTDESNTIRHPLDNSQTLSIPQFIALMNYDPELREMGGWNVANKLDGETDPMTRWERLLAHTNSEHGDPALKALGLGETAVTTVRKKEK